MWYKPLNGYALSGSTVQCRWVNYPLGPSTAWGHRSLPAPATNSYYMTQLLARTNPSRPVVDLPVAIYELRELPGLIKDSMHFLREGWKSLSRKEKANQYLAYQYGWRPLVKDLSRLLDFHDHFHKRSEMIHAIFEGGGVKRRRTLQEDMSLGPTDTVTISSVTGSSTINVRRQTLTRRRIWATTRWVPDSTKLPPKGNREISQLARNSVLGLHIEAATVWEALPWSWLVDWFTTSGDYLNANRNAVPAVHLHGCVMTHTESYRLTSRPKGIDSCTETAPGAECLEYLSTKVRRVQNNPSISAYFPFLSRTQVSILGALSVQRIRR